MRSSNFFLLYSETIKMIGFKACHTPIAKMTVRRVKPVNLKFKADLLASRFTQGVLSYKPITLSRERLSIILGNKNREKCAW